MRCIFLLVYLQHCSAARKFRELGVQAEVDDLWEEVFGLPDLWTEAMQMANNLMAASINEPEAGAIAPQDGQAYGWA